MKIIIRSAAMAVLLIAASCGKDDVSSQVEEQDDQITTQEQTPLAANIVSDNVIIKGSTKKEGMLPAASGNIGFSTAKSGKTAFLNEGFTVAISSEAAISGAYLRFKQADGEEASTYYDIDLSENSESGKRASLAGRKGKSIGLLTAKGEGFELDVDFTNNIEPGTFCYDISVYDTEGNVSEVKEICATVESWGGKAALIASWDMTKEEDNETDDGTIQSRNVGEEYCEDDSATCSSGESLPYQDCYKTEFGLMAFKEDGTFIANFKNTEKYIDYSASISDCKVVLNEIERVDNYKGYWAYNATTESLTLVIYEYSYNDENELLKVEKYAKGDAELLFDGPLQLEGNTLVISDEDYNLDGTIDDKFTAYFTKK